MVLVVKNRPANTGDLRDMGLLSGLGRSHGGGHGNLLQYSCLENPLDRGDWRAAAHRVAQSWTWLSNFTSLVPQLVKNLPAVQETPVPFLGQEDLLEEG